MFGLTIIKQCIRLYQQTLSPDHGPLRALFPAGVCRFDPTCSEYMYHAVERHSWHGLLLGLHRLMRCHPFARGGRDPVP